MERRVFDIERLEVRAEEGEKAKRIAGYAAVFDKLSVVMWGFREKIAPGAFRESLQEDVRALWNHDSNHVLGRTTAGTLRLDEDGHGLKVEIDPPASASGFVESIERGDVTQMSFGFRVLEDKWDEDDEGQDIRTLLRVKLYEVSPVAFPAYPDTEIGVRAWLGDEPERPEKQGASAVGSRGLDVEDAPVALALAPNDESESDQRALVEIEATETNDSAALRAQAEVELDLDRLRLAAV